jgi:energy-converting hydrogenase Eha subunit H
MSQFVGLDIVCTLHKLSVTPHATICVLLCKTSIFRYGFIIERDKNKKEKKEKKEKTEKKEKKITSPISQTASIVSDNMLQYTLRLYCVLTNEP